MSVPQLRFKDEGGREFPAWEEMRLGDVGEIITGKTPSTADSSLWNGDIQFVTPTDIKDQKYQHETQRKVALNTKLKVLPKNSIMFTCIASIGKMSLSVSPCITNQQINALIPKVGFENEYIYYALLNITDFIKSTQANTTLPIINKTEFSKFVIPVPVFAEQTKIASFLTEVDEKISQFTQKCELLTQYKKGVMQEIFSQALRFKDDEGRTFPAWEGHEVGEIFKVTRGNVLSMTLVTPTPSEQNLYPVFSSQTKNKGLAGYFNSYLYEDSITWTTDGANAGDVNYREGKFYCTNVCGVLISNEGYANACVAELINAVSRKFVSYVGNPKLMNNVMAKITIDFPCVAEQTKIANFLTAIDDKIANAQAQLAAAKQYKQGLLQQMFV